MIAMHFLELIAKKELSGITICNIGKSSKNMDFLAAFAMNEGEGSRVPLMFFFFKNVLFKKTFTIKTCFAVCT